MAQGSILTTIGLQKLASATPENQLQITHMAVGDGGGGWSPLDPGMTALVNETWRGPASAPIRDGENSQTLIFETVIPGNVGGFMIRELGLFDDDGDLIAIGQTGATEKPAAGSSSQLTLTVRLRVRLQNAAQVTLVYQDVPYIDHQGLGNRSALNAHPIESISGLRAELNALAVLGQYATEDAAGAVQLATEAEANPGTLAEASNAKAATILRVFQALSSQLASKIIRPIGSQYIQFAETDGTFASAKLPSTLFGGTWTLKFNTESVYFRTEGTLAADGRADGIQGDAIRNITGSLQLNAVGSLPQGAITRTAAGARHDGSNSGGTLMGFDASLVVPTAAENRVKNRLIRVWERTA